MRLLPLFLAASVPVSIAFAQPNQTTTTVANSSVARVPRLGTPKEQIEEDIKGFFNALNALTPNQIRYDIPSFISGARIGYFGLNEWTNYFFATWGKVQFRLDAMEIDKVEEDKARVKVSYGWVSTKTPPPVNGKVAKSEVLMGIEDETFDLKREIVPWIGAENNPEKWRILPPSFEKRGQSLSLAHIAYYSSQRPGTWLQLRAEISMNRLKELGMGAMQSAMDYDEQLLFQNEFWRDALKPYVRSESLFIIPGTQTPYTFNDQLSDKSLAAINEPAETVLFYEGADEKPTFRYDGKAAICFADGHVKLVSPEEAATLRWKP